MSEEVPQKFLKRTIYVIQATIPAFFYSSVDVQLTGTNAPEILAYYVATMYTDT